MISFIISGLWIHAEEIDKVSHDLLCHLFILIWKSLLYRTVLVSSSCQLDPAYNTWEESLSERWSTLCCDVDFSVGIVLISELLREAPPHHGCPHSHAGALEQSKTERHREPACMHLFLPALGFRYAGSSCWKFLPWLPHNDGRESGTGSWNEPLASISFLFLRVLSRSDRNETGTLAW